MNTILFVSSIFSPGQITAIVIVSVLIGLLIAGNGALFYFLRKRKTRKLCTSRLQNKRDALLEHLKNINDDGSLMEGPLGGINEGEEEAVDDDSDEDTDEDDDEEEDEPAAVETVTPGDDEDITQNEILAVADMSEYTRRAFGVESDEFDNKRYYVRYTPGFEAKLRDADDDVKQRYAELATELGQYKGVKIKSSFRQQRIYKGRKTLGIILFRGKTLCVAFALDPKEYAETKYRGIDKSDKKRFAKTPMLYKLTSARRVEYAKYLIVQLADAHTIVLATQVEQKPVDLSQRTPDELFVAGGLRIAILGEAPELEPEPEPELTVEDTVDGPMVEAASTDDETDELAVETPEGRIVFDRSFAARIIQADDALKARYSELKNYILAYKGVRARTSWKRETFAIGRNSVATFAVRGKTLMLYLATDPSRFDDTKYKVENMSEVASRRKTPLLFRVRSDRRTAYAKQLIDIVLAEKGAVRAERRPQDYTVPYRSTDALVKRGLIKITQTDSKGFARADKNK